MGAFGSHEEILREEEIDALVDQSGFNQHDIVALFQRFKSLDRGCDGYITRTELLCLPELAMNPLRDRVLAQFNLHEKDNMNFADFVKFISVFRPGATEEEKALRAFKIFDLNDNGFITKEEFIEVLGLMTGKHTSKEELTVMVDQIFLETDKNNDGKLGFEDFRSSLSGIDLLYDFTIGPWKED